MKIAFLTPEFPHSKTGPSGGIGTSIMNLCQGLINAGHEALVLVYGQKEDEVFYDNGMAIYRISNVPLKGISNYKRQKKIQKLINQLHESGKLDLVEAPDWNGITSFINVNCPIVVRLHGSDTYFCHLENRPVKWRNKFHEKRALKKADQLLSVSKYTADLTNEIFNLNREFTVMPNSIDAKKFDNPKNISSENQTILYFGTLIRKKGMFELPLIFNEVNQKNPSAKLILIGKDAADVLSGGKSTWEMMQPLFSASALKNVEYLGSVSYDSMVNHILDASVCVFPTFAEALPVSWLEAMAMKKPIVASNIGWAKEIISDDNDGFLESPKNHTEYAGKILQLLSDIELQKRIGEIARITILKNFDIAVMAKKNIAFYQTVVKR